MYPLHICNFAKMHVLSETVEKPEIGEFDVCKSLILLHAKSLKSLYLGFFDSLSMYLYLNDIWFSGRLSIFLQEKR
jgi:hypothetical protein